VEDVRVAVTPRVDGNLIEVTVSAVLAALHGSAFLWNQSFKAILSGRIGASVAGERRAARQRENACPNLPQWAIAVPKQAGVLSIWEISLPRCRLRAYALTSLGGRLLVTAVISISVTAHAAHADVDLTGDWYVELANPAFGLTFDEVWSITQTGNTVVVSPPGSFTGTINSDTGAFALTKPFFCPVPGKSIPETLDGTLTPDGKAFTGVSLSYGTTPHGCVGFLTPVWASRDPCGNGVVDPGEECDDGNEVNGDGCDANCTVTRCGNGIVTASEQCDDGNQIAGDSCPPGCSYSASRSLIRGSRKSPLRDHNDCHVEWYVVNPRQKPDRHHLPTRQQTCHDADPTCDISGFDAARAPIPDSTSRLCRFQVVTCLNNQDPDLPSCTPDGITAVNVVSPDPNKTANAALRSVLSADRSALEYALAHLLDPIATETGYSHASPLTAMQQNYCSAPFEIDVVAGNRSVMLTTTSTGATASDQPQTSSLQLICRSASAR
jgi:cysteine-rich repeat protein